MKSQKTRFIDWLWILYESYHKCVEEGNERLSYYYAGQVEGVVSTAPIIGFRAQANVNYTPECPVIEYIKVDDTWLVRDGEMTDLFTLS